jgi:hypothetical protein
MNILAGICKLRGNLGDVGVDGILILKWLMKMQDTAVWTGVTKLMVGCC